MEHYMEHILIDSSYAPCDNPVRVSRGDGGPIEVMKRGTYELQERLVGATLVLDDELRFAADAGDAYIVSEGVYCATSWNNPKYAAEFEEHYGRPFVEDEVYIDVYPKIDREVLKRNWLAADEDRDEDDYDEKEVLENTPQFFLRIEPSMFDQLEEALKEARSALAAASEAPARESSDSPIARVSSVHKSHAQKK